MNIQLIKTILIKLFGNKLMAYAQALRFIYLLKKMRNKDPEVQFLNRFLKKGDIVIDIGANSANWTYYLHQFVGEEGYVYAFEADPYYALATDIAIKLMRLKGVRLFPFGLSNTDEDVSFRTTRPSGLRLSGQGHVDRSADGNEDGVEIVHLRRLDSLIDEYPQLLHVSLIKCDVEGYELFVLSGANEILRRARPILIIEVGNYEKHGYSARELYEFVDDRGYSVLAVTGGDALAETTMMLEHDNALSENRILIPNEKVDIVKDLI